MSYSNFNDKCESLINDDFDLEEIIEKIKILKLYRAISSLKPRQDI